MDISRRYINNNTAKIQYERKTYYKDEDIHVYLEEADEDVYIHVAINHMSKPVLRKIREVWGEVVIKMYFLGYERLLAYTKDSRIIRLIGGANKLTTYKDYEVYEWDLS